MILSIGEILVDTYKTIGTQQSTCMHYVGGAPFNVAVNAKQCGGEVGFIGRVGKDEYGRMLIKECHRAGLDYLYMEVDPHRATTEAIVTVSNGERDFAFNRTDTADYHIDASKIDLARYNNISIIHLGSLMLSEELGRRTASDIVRLARDAGLIISFDVNLRLDIYSDIDSAIEVYKPYIDSADIVKFSQEELLLFAGESQLMSAIDKVAKPNQLLLVTLGSAGSMCVYKGEIISMPTIAVTPIDTTGAGDAFMGAFLAYIDGKAWTHDNIRDALDVANKRGAMTTQFLGAIKL